MTTTITDIAAGSGNDPVPTRAGSFAADRRDLPVFAALTREMGWLGLHMPPAARAAETEAR